VDVFRRADADDALFLAGGVAFNVLLAGIPFILLLTAGLGFILDQSTDAANAVVQTTIANLLPGGLVASGSILDPLLVDVVRTRTVVGASSAIAFLWFASRLFTTLRAVIAFVFMHGRDRGYFHGKLVDLNLIFVSVLLLTAWVSISAWLVVTTGRVGSRLAAAGFLESVAGGIEVVVARLLALLVLVLIFASLYRWLPRRRTDWRAALLGAAGATALFEFARWLFAALGLAYPPSSVYTGTLGAIFLVMFWTYYAALIFVLGAEVAHVVEMRLVARGDLTPRSPLTAEFATTAEARAAGAAQLGVPIRKPPDP
jgi:membrane protein